VAPGTSRSPDGRDPPRIKDSGPASTSYDRVIEHGAHDVPLPVHRQRVPRIAQPELTAIVRAGLRSSAKSDPPLHLDALGGENRIPASPANRDAVEHRPEDVTLLLDPQRRAMSLRRCSHEGHRFSSPGSRCSGARQAERLATAVR
jgi:hypothetical protein